MARKNVKRSKNLKKPVKSKELPPIEIVGTYSVEAIVEAKAIPNTNGKRFMYQVQWAGYPGENTWEPQEHLLPDCERLLMSFWREIGAIDLAKTKSLKPSQEWIEAEIWYYQHTVNRLGLEHHQRAIGYNEETGQLTVYA